MSVNDLKNYVYNVANSINNKYPRALDIKDIDSYIDKNIKDDMSNEDIIQKKEEIDRIAEEIVQKYLKKLEYLEQLKEKYKDKEYILKNIKELDISNLNYKEMDNMFFHYGWEKYLESYDKEGMKSVVGENSKGIDKEPSIFFSKGVEGVLELWDVWLKWRLNRLNNPMFKDGSDSAERYLNGNISEDEKKELYHWVNYYNNKMFLDNSALLKELFEYQYNEMLYSNYFTLDLRENDEFKYDQIDIKKQKAILDAIKNGRNIRPMQLYQYGSYSDFSSPIVDKWNMQTIPGKNVVIEPSRINRLVVGEKKDVYSIMRFMYENYKNNVDEDKQVKFDLLDKYIEYIDKKVVNNEKDESKVEDNRIIENILLSNSRGYLDIIKNEYGPYMSEEKLSFLEKLKESNIIKVESNGKEYIKNQIREILNDVSLTDEEKQKKTSNLEVPLAHGGRVFDDGVIHFYPYDKLKDSSKMTTEQLAYKCNEVLIHELLHYFIRPKDMDLSNNPSLKGINSFTSEGLVDMCARDIHTKYGLIPDYNSDYASNVLFVREALGNVGTRDEQMNLVFNGSKSDFYQRTTTEDYNSIKEAVDAKNNNTSFDRVLFGIAKIGEGVLPYSAEQLYRGSKNISANYPSKDAALNDITQQICLAHPASVESVNSVVSTYTSESKSNIKQMNNTKVKTLKLSNNNSNTNSNGNGNNNTSNGFMNVMILSLLVGFFEGIVFVLTYLFLAK